MFLEKYERQAFKVLKEDRENVLQRLFRDAQNILPFKTEGDGILYPWGAIVENKYIRIFQKETNVEDGKRMVQSLLKHLISETENYDIEYGTIYTDNSWKICLRVTENYGPTHLTPVDISTFSRRK